MKFEAIKRAKEPEKQEKTIPIIQPYITDFFNVLEYENVDVNQEEFAAIRVLNALAWAIIKRRRLPKILIIMADLDLIQNIDVFDKDAPVMLKDWIFWFVRQIDVTIRWIKESILELKPGGLVGFDPKIIHIRMIRRACNFSEESKRYAVHDLRAKNNDALNDAAAKRSHNIMTINSCQSHEDFDHKGNLTPAGKRHFWKEIDDLIRKFELNKIKLRPNPKNPPRDSERDERKDNYRYKLPTPSNYHHRY